VARVAVVHPRTRATDIAQGGMLQGHIGDEAMVLARLATRELGESTHSMPARPPEFGSSRIYASVSRRLSCYCGNWCGLASIPASFANLSWLRATVMWAAPRFLPF